MIVSAFRGPGLSPLFPDEGGGGLALSQARLRDLSRGYSALYLAVIEAVRPEYARALGVPERAADLVLREALVSPLHLFLDRLLRLEEFTRGRRDAAVAAATRAADYDEAGPLRTAAQDSVVFNAGLLAELAPLLGLPLAEAPPPAEPALPPVPRGRNSNFDGERLFSKSLRKLGGLFARGRRRLPCASLSYTDAALREAGFLQTRLESVTGRARFSPGPRAPELRERLLERPLAACTAVDAFLASAGFQPPAGTAPLRAALGSWIARQFPSAYLEAFPGNLAAARSVLAPFAPRPFVLAEVNGVDSTILMAAARSLGMEVVGLQHGGHYGYIEDHTLAIDLEYSFYDRFVSWGWEGIPDWEVCRAVRVEARSCPWLEQRRRHWARAVPPRARDPRGKRHDVLLMSNKLYRFPPAPSGAAICRSDRAPEMSALLVSLAREASAGGLSILHKPYNAGTVTQLRGTFAEMARVAGRLYEELPGSGKGLTPELVSSCGLVLWDQPGTGFLECLAADLPTLCLWPRIYSEEEPRRAAAFRALEEAGLLHRNVPGAVAEALRFRADPARWNAPARRAAREAFSREFGRADAGWRQDWDRWLSSLAT